MMHRILEALSEVEKHGSTFEVDFIAYMIARCDLAGVNTGVRLSDPIRPRLCTQYNDCRARLEEAKSAPTNKWAALLELTGEQDRDDYVGDIATCILKMNPS